MFYSKSTGGFYDRAIHGDNIPADAVEITANEHAALLEAQSIGKIIQADQNGRPVAVDPPKPSAAAMWERIKAERDRRMEESGYKVGDKWFHSDQKSRSQQLGLILLGANIPEGLQWKTMDGSFIAMTPALAQSVLAAGAASDFALFSKAEALHAALVAAADPATFDPLVGWPKGYGE